MVIRTTSLEQALKVLKSNEELAVTNNNSKSLECEYFSGGLSELPNLPKDVQDRILSMSSDSFGELEFILKCLNHHEKKEHFKTSDELLETIRYGCEKIINYIYDKR
jgi:hypothetical protein